MVKASTGPLSLVSDLSAPLHSKWRPRRRCPRADEISLQEGILPVSSSRHPAERWPTAYADFADFLAAGKIPLHEGYPLHIETDLPGVAEEYVLRLDREKGTLRAVDAEGVRRALVWIQDELLRRDGAFLPLGTTSRKPALGSRISRSIYSPINRAPHHRDELADDVDYYPEGYLRRLAHCGVNRLFLVVKLSELCPSRVIPEYGRASARRLAKLRGIVDRCARYDIRLLPLCIDPARFTADSSVLRAHPDLAGHRMANQVFFCTESKTGKAYLDEVGRVLFENVPGLGGLIVLSVGEAGSHCYSGAYPGADAHNNCPRCSRLAPWTVMDRMFRRFQKGIHAVDPDAEVISWPYGQFWYWKLASLPEAAAHVPPGVALMHNFESSGESIQLGKRRRIWDYSLSYIGPSATFVRCAKAARAKGTAVLAKLQVGCSFETATVPFVPVPGILYDKYRSLHTLGVTGAMHGWYHGNYPSLMSRAAVELSMKPFPRTEKAFLLALARRDWGDEAGKVVRAWQWFKKGYTQLPATHLLGWYGPFSDGVTWPLHLEPRNRPLSPSWELGWTPSGDHVGDCVPTFTLREILILFGRLVAAWEKGVHLLEGLRPRRGQDAAFRRDADIPKVLLLLFRSGLHIFTFYALREQLAFAAPNERAALLRKMADIVHREIAGTRRLQYFVARDPRLGFHSEAEGYKFDPPRLSRRIHLLRKFLTEEFPKVRRRASQRRNLFPAYTGDNPRAVRYPCHSLSLPAEEASCRHFGLYSNQTGRYQPVPSEAPAFACRWRVARDRTSLHFHVNCSGGIDHRGAFALAGSWRDYWNHEHVRINLKVNGLWPHVQFMIHPNGSYSVLCGGKEQEGASWEVQVTPHPDGWAATARIPYAAFGFDSRERDRLRLAIEWHQPFAGNSLAALWVKPKPSPFASRLTWGNIAPNADFGWLLLA